MKVLLEVRWGKIAQLLQQAMMIEPPHPFECCEFHVLEAAPGPAAVNHLRFE